MKPKMQLLDPRRLPRALRLIIISRTPRACAAALIALMFLSLNSPALDRESVTRGTLSYSRALEVTEPRSAAESSDLIKLNDSGGTYTLPTLNGSTSMTLVGQIKTLEVAGLNGTARLDTSALKAETIRITGPINGETQLILSAARGRIVFEGSLNGAPQIRLTARSVEFAQPINGSGRIDVTLARDGSLQFVELAGSTELIWRGASPDDSPPKISPGQIRGSARFREGPP
jgi:hypothetical protein